MKLIDKDVLTEKLFERRIKHREFGGSPHSEYGHEDDEILSLIDTLEVKEVDLKKEIEEYLSIYWSNEKDLHPFLGHVAKHFFALGMAVSNKAQKGE